MPRFERHRDGRHQFWEVERDGLDVTFRFGQVGTAGRSRTKQHRSEQAAQNAVQTGEREMTGRGYRRVFETPTELAVEDSPVFDRLAAGGDTEAWMVHADWLQQRGDPLGDQVALALQGKVVPPALDELRGLSAEVRCETRNAYLDSLELIAGVGNEDPDQVVAQLLQRPEAMLLRRLRLVSPHAGSVVPLLQLPALASLTVSIHRFRQTAALEPLDLDGLAARCPRLVELAICSAFELHGTQLLPRIRHLRIGSWPFTDPAQVAALAPDRLTLEHLDEDDLQRLLRSGLVARVPHLVFDSSGVDLLVRFGGPAHITFTRSLHERYASIARIPGLERVTVQGNVSPVVLQALERRGIAVDGSYRVLPAEEPTPAAPERPRDLRMLRLEHTDGNTPRFWEIGRADNVLHVRYGQLGHQGRWYHKAYPDDEIAEEARQERLKEKLRQSYQVLAERISHP